MRFRKQGAAYTYKRQLGYHDEQNSKEIDNEIRQVIMCKVSAEQEDEYGYYEKKLLRWGVLISIIDLLPHVQVVVCSGVEFKRYTADPVEHQKGGTHVGDVDEGPG